MADPSGSALANAEVLLVNFLTNYRATATTGGDGRFQMGNIPFNTYHLEVKRTGFATSARDIDIRTQVAQRQDFTLALAGQSTTLDVHAFGDEVLENVPYAHTDTDATLLNRLAVSAPGSRLSDAIVFAAPGVVADSDGFFHPLGDHAQTGFAVDGQPVTDQQSKRFSTQLPLNAIQSMELITGAPNAEYGDKTSLVVNTVTKSGLGGGLRGAMWAGYGSFGSPVTENSFALGGPRWGTFVVANGERSGRFLDAPEFAPQHAIGNSQTIFNRSDYQPDSRNSFHLNLMAARNWFQIPNTLDVPEADQRQQVRSINVAPGYQKVLSPEALLSFNGFFRKDWVDFYPSRDGFADSPVTAAQNRTLENKGLRADLSYVRGRINFKTGFQYVRTDLKEDFRLGITNPDELGEDFSEELEPYDLTRPGGEPFRFNERGKIEQVAWYAQNALSLGNLVLNTGLRVESYQGLVKTSGWQPRVGVSYRLRQTGTILRASYSRTMETPYNENLLLSSSTGSGGLAANAFFGFGTVPLEPGRRNQFNAGFQQAVGRYLVAEADYFWKFTDNAYDFGVLYNTPITFPVSWNKSKIDGLSVRVSTREWKGFQAFHTIGSTRARFFPPSTGGLLFASPLEEGSVFRIDHDQKFQQNTHLRYQFRQGPWMAWTWRFDSGLVTTGVASCADGVGLTENQKSTIGFFGNDQRCGSALIDIPQPGEENDDHNPARMKGRHLFHINAGHDNLFRGERWKVSIRGGVVNLTNKVALYNFLSTFGGTHFVTPRTLNVAVGVSF